MEPDIIQRRQREITRLCIQSALLLLQHGAESMLVEQLSCRLGKALGVEEVESSISANAVVLSTIHQGHCVTSTRKNVDRGINMHVVTEVQRIVILTEHRLLDIEEVQKRLDNIKPLRYPRWLMVVMVGLSCACFCRLAGGNLDTVTTTFFASALAMYARQLLTSLQINPLINFFATAFVATTASGLLVNWLDVSKAPIAMASCVLLLVPGFPLINAVADMFKGHINTGMARWMMASLLTLATCIGVVVAMAVWGFRSWL